MTEKKESWRNVKGTFLEVKRRVIRKQTEEAESGEKKERCA